MHGDGQGGYGSQDGHYRDMVHFADGDERLGYTGVGHGNVYARHSALLYIYISLPKVGMVLNSFTVRIVGSNWPLRFKF